MLNAANNGRLVIVNFVQQWRSHAQKAQAQGCPRSAATDVAWPCYVFALRAPTIANQKNAIPANTTAYAVWFGSMLRT